MLRIVLIPQQLVNTLLSINNHYAVNGCSAMLQTWDKMNLKDIVIKVYFIYRSGDTSGVRATLWATGNWTAKSSCNNREDVAIDAL